MRRERHFLLLLAVCLAVFRPGAAYASGECSTAAGYDVVVYGGTSAGVAAAVQVARMGKSVVIIEPGLHLGGMSSSGLGRTDVGNAAAIGGISLEFYRRVRAFYSRERRWRYYFFSSDSRRL